MGRCRDRPLAVASVPPEHGREHGLVELDEQFDIGQPAAQLGSELSDALGERLAEVATRSGVGDHSITARPLHHRSQRPWAGNRELDGACVSLCMLLKLIKVRAQRTDGQPMISAGGVGEPPSGRLQVDGQTGEKRSRASDQLRVWSACRQAPAGREDQGTPRTRS